MCTVMMQYLRNNVKGIMIGVVVVFIVSCFAGYGMYVRGRGSSGGDYPVAKLDGKKIMRSQVEMRLREVAEQFGDRVTSGDVPMIRRMILDDIVVGMELTKAAKAEGIKVAKEEVDQYLASMQAQFPTKEAYDEYLKRSGMTERELRRKVEENIAVGKLMEKVTASASVDAGEVRKFYDATKDAFFKRPEGYTVNVVAFRGKEAAQRGRTRLLKGEAWDSVMGAMSGDLGNFTPYDKPIFVSKKDLADDLKSVISLKVGSYSNLVKVGSDDYLMVLKRSNEKERVMAFDEVKERIEGVLLDQKRGQMQRAYVADLLKKAPLEILDESIFKVASGDEGESSNKGN